MRSLQVHTEEPAISTGAAATPRLPVASDALGAELRSTARGGALTLGGSLFGTAMGFVLVLVLARALGAGGSGLVLQVIAVFMIAASIARLGMDTTAVWLLPRLAAEAPERIRGACTVLVLAAVGTGAVIAVAYYLLSATGRTEPLGPLATSGALDAVVWALPASAALLVALAGLRGCGRVLPYTLVGNVAVPSGRPLLVVVAAAAGGSAVAASVAWAAPLVPAALVALWLLHRSVGAVEARHGVAGSPVPDRSVARRIRRFALPRTLSAVLEESMVWFDVLLVGIIAGPVAAGVYGAASRFVSAGSALLTALRIVVAPRFSAHLVAGRMAEAQSLYGVTAGWVLLLGGPVYVLLACFASPVLALLGPGFDQGATAMVVLCCGGLGIMVGGNVQSMLLMAGRSGWAAVDKLVVVTANIAGNLVLVPQHGLLGAAVVWAACMWLDTLLAVVQVRRFTGIRPELGSIGRTLGVVLVATGLPSLGAIAVLGDAIPALLVATALSGLLVVGYCVLDRRRVHLDALLAMLPLGRGAGGAR